MPASAPNRSLPAVDRVAVIAIPALKFLVHLLTASRYGYFRDELYSMDLARRLDWGYADCAPMVALWSRLGMFMGPSLVGFRLPAVLAGAALIAITVLITRELGGGSYAQRLAALSMLLAPGVLIFNIFLTMNAFEPVFWMGCVLSVLLAQRSGDGRYWLLFGLFAGLGLMNKHSSLFFGAALAAGLLFSPLRREFGRKWIWMGALVAFLIFLPNVVWQIRHDFATVELLRNVQRMHKNVDLSPVSFLLQQILSMNPALLAVWGGGIAWTLFGANGRRFRWIGVTWLAAFAIFVALKAKVYYLFPIYGMAFAAGGVVWESWTRGRRIWRIAVPAAAALFALVAAPTVLPILPPEQLIAYLDSLHLRPPKTEVHHSGPLPQHFGDQFGWESLTREVAQCYRGLSEEERSHTAIFASNYGEAGAIDFYGPKYGLPSAISAHQNHWFWGPRGKGEKGTNLIVTQTSVESLSRFCEEVRVLGQHHDPFGMEEENAPILYCRGLRVSLAAVWPKLKHWN